MVPLPFCFLDACIDLTALKTLVEYRITGFPVIDDDWKLVRILTFSQLTLPVVCHVVQEVGLVI